MHSKMMYFYLVATLLSLLFVAVQAKSQLVYSFAEGKSHPEGLKHGARGHACLKEFHYSLHGSDMEFLKHVDNNNKNGTEVTDDHVAAAIFLMYGEKGVDNLCAFSQRWTESQKNRRLNTVMEQEEQEPDAKVSSERRTQTGACSGGAQVGYPGSAKMDPSGVYGGFVTNRVGPLLPDGAGANSRTSPSKMISEAQLVLDNALEGEYQAVICGTYFSAVTDILSVPDFVVFKQGPVLDGINSLSCGVAERTAQAMQQNMRQLLSDGMRHDALINRAEMTATYQNTMTIAQEVCGMSSSVETMNLEVETIKEKIVMP